MFGRALTGLRLLPNRQNHRTFARSPTSQRVRMLHESRRRSRPETDPDAFPAVGLKPQSASDLATRLELLRTTLRPTPHVPLAMDGMNLFAKLEFVNPVGSIKDRAAYWILKRAAERGEICEKTTVIESSSGNFAAALAAF